MKKNDEIKSAASADDDKIHISKNIFEVNREMKKKAAEEELKKQAEREKMLAEARKKAEEARAKRLEEERLELIRLKQGIIEESDAIKQEESEVQEVKTSLPKKISSFLYLNKWWLTIAVVFCSISGILIHSFLTRPNPDLTILIIGTNYPLAEESQLEEYVEAFMEDYNENGKITSLLSKENELYENAFKAGDNAFVALQKGRYVLRIVAYDEYYNATVKEIEFWVK